VLALASAKEEVVSGAPGRWPKKSPAASKRWQPTVEPDFEIFTKMPLAEIPKLLSKFL
jgi:hypothetical protein